MSGSFLLTCREVAKTCPDILIRAMLRATADELQQALQNLGDLPSLEHMQDVVALWTKAHVIMQKAKPVPDPAPQSGHGEMDRMAA